MTCLVLQPPFRSLFPTKSQQQWKATTAQDGMETSWPYRSTLNPHVGVKAATGKMYMPWSLLPRLTRWLSGSTPEPGGSHPSSSPAMSRDTDSAAYWGTHGFVFAPLVDGADPFDRWSLPEEQMQNVWSNNDTFTYGAGAYNDAAVVAGRVPSESSLEQYPGPLGSYRGVAPFYSSSNNLSTESLGQQLQHATAAAPTRTTSQPASPPATPHESASDQTEKREIPGGLPRTSQSERARPTCDICPQSFSRAEDMMRHKNDIHGLATQKFRCSVCHWEHSRRDKVLSHCRKCIEDAVRPSWW